MRFWEGATLFVLFIVISALARRVSIHLQARAHVRRTRASQKASMEAWRDSRRKKKENA
jgi:hypothetical protein